MNCNSHKQYLFRYLSIVHRSTRGYIQSRICGTEMENCHPPYLICILHHQGLSQDDLVREFRVDKGSVAKTLRQMEVSGFITRKEDPEDRRRYRIHLTDKGHAAIPHLVSLAEDAENILTKGMTGDEITVFHGLLEKAASNILSVTKKGSNPHGFETL